jgi:hypothetical protein
MKYKKGLEAYDTNNPSPHVIRSVSQFIKAGFFAVPAQYVSTKVGLNRTFGASCGESC